MHFHFQQTCCFLFLIHIASVGATRADEPNLVALGAQVEKLAGGFVFTEGPAGDAHGNVYFSDIPNQRIHIWSAAGKLSTFRENSGRANGLFFDKDGNLLACEGGNRRVTSMTPTGEVTVLADHFEGKLLNSPNDLWIDPKGGVYFTDPRYGSQEGLEQGGFHYLYLTRAAIHVYSPAGDRIAVLKFPEGPANVTFAGKDRKTLFVTARTGFYALRMNVRGQ